MLILTVVDIELDHQVSQDLLDFVQIGNKGQGNRLQIFEGQLCRRGKSMKDTSGTKM